jgi:spermidine/putrescine transport system permease protein
VKRDLPGTILKLYLAIVMAYLFAPVASLALMSFHEGKIQSFPIESFSLKWYQEAWENSAFWEGLWTSVRVALLVAPLSTFLGFMSAHLLSRHPPRRPLIYVALVSVPAFVPLLLSGMAMLMYYSEIQLFGSLWAIVAAHVCYSSPFALVILYVSYQSLNVELEEAARNLGAGAGRVIFMVVLPQLWRALVAAGAISFLISWDEFILAWFVGGFTKTLPTVIYGTLGTSFNPSLNAVGTIAILFSGTLFLVAAFLVQRIFPRGLDVS